MLLIGDCAPGKKQARLTFEAPIILGNLEGPLLPPIHSFVATPKAGPSLFSCVLPNNTRQFIFALANNHIMDYGLPGLDSTMSLLGQRNFKACGAGKDIDIARKPIVVEENGVRV